MQQPAAARPLQAAAERSPLCERGRRAWVYHYAAADLTVAAIAGIGVKASPSFRWIATWRARGHPELHRTGGGTQATAYDGCNYSANPWPRCRNRPGGNFS